MIKYSAIFALYPQVTTIRDHIAYDVNENIVEYDEMAVETKTAELLTQEETDKQAKIDARQSALNKLMALGLTEEEALALGK